LSFHDGGIFGDTAASNHPLLAAPCAVVRHCRAKIGGAVDHAMSPVSDPIVVTSCLLPRHHAWRGTGVSPR